MATTSKVGNITKTFRKSKENSPFPVDIWKKFLTFHLVKWYFYLYLFKNRFDFSYLNFILVIVLFVRVWSF